MDVKFACRYGTRKTGTDCVKGGAHGGGENVANHGELDVVNDEERVEHDVPKNERVKEKHGRAGAS